MASNIGAQMQKMIKKVGFLVVKSLQNVGAYAKMYKQKIRTRIACKHSCSRKYTFRSGMLLEKNERRGGETEEFYYGSYHYETAP